MSSHSNAKRDVGRLAWPVLGLVAAALAGTVVLEIKGGDDPMPVPEQSMMSVPPPQATLVVSPHGRDDRPQLVEGTLNRPLFSQNRRPPADAPRLVAALPNSLPRLTGVVVSPAGGFAIFASIEGGRPIVVREGDQVGAEVIEAVAAGQVTLRGPNGTVVLHPSFDEKPMQATRLNPIRRRGGHDAAVLNRLPQPAT